MPKLADHPVLVTRQTKASIVQESERLTRELRRQVTYGEVIERAMKALAEQEAAR